MVHDECQSFCIQHYSRTHHFLLMRWVQFGTGFDDTRSRPDFFHVNVISIFSPAFAKEDFQGLQEFDVSATIWRRQCDGRARMPFAS